MKPNLMPFKTLLRLFNVFFTCSTADTLIVLSLVDDALEDSSTGVSLVCSLFKIVLNLIRVNHEKIK